LVYGFDVRAIKRFTVRPVLPDSLRPLEELATNLRWSWHHETQDLFVTVDAQAWRASNHDPVRFLGSVSPQRLTSLSKDKRFLKQLEIVRADLEDYLTGDRWYQSLGSEVPQQIAYFSPEFGISAVLPQYSGGLGILAGDHLKSASDLGVPILGVGLLYRHGYFRQLLSREGWQQERYPLIDPDELPLAMLRRDDGTPVQISISLPGAKSSRPTPGSRKLAGCRCSCSTLTSKPTHSRCVTSPTGCTAERQITVCSRNCCSG